MKTRAIRFLALALVLVSLMGVMTGCGKKTETAQPTAQPAETQQPAAQPTQQPAPAATPEPTPEPEEDFNGKLVSEGMMPLQFAKNFTIEMFKGGYRLISAGTGGYKYLVVPEGMKVPEGLEEGTYVLQMPINRVYMASTGMMSLVDAIGANDRGPLVGTDKSGWYLPNVVAAMDAGTIAFGGKYSEPDFELMVANDIQLHINTTMIDSKPEVLEKFEELKIPSLVEDSSKEGHPLARVEWVKLFGVLFGMEDEANAYFDSQVKMVEAATSPSLGKTVAMGYVASDGEKCYARNGGDYYAQMLGMAGGDYVCADMEPTKAGNSNMTFEEWYNKFKDADYFFYMNFAAKFNSIQEMIEFNPLFADFKAVKEGRVWVTSKDFTQSTAAIAGILQDMNTILKSDDPQNVTTDHLIKIS